jgi:hypothetical protein
LRSLFVVSDNDAERLHTRIEGALEGKTYAEVKVEMRVVEEIRKQVDNELYKVLLARMDEQRERIAQPSTKAALLKAIEVCLEIDRAPLRDSLQRARLELEKNDGAGNQKGKPTSKNHR